MHSADEAPLYPQLQSEQDGGFKCEDAFRGNPSGPVRSHRAIDPRVPAILPRRRSQSKESGSCTRPSFSSAISSWFIRTSRRARTCDGQSVDVGVTDANGAAEEHAATALQRPFVTDDGKGPTYA